MGYLRMYMQNITYIFYILHTHSHTQTHTHTDMYTYIYIEYYIYMKKNSKECMDTCGYRASADNITYTLKGSKACMDTGGYIPVDTYRWTP